MTIRNVMAIVAFLLIAVMGTTAAQTPDSLDEAGIRRARDRWNRAIEKRDAPAMRALLSETYHLTGGSGHLADPAALAAGAARIFAQRPDLVYVFRPTRIRVVADHGVASEFGEWTERWTEPSGLTKMRGTYYVMWRHQASRWVIEAEVNVPESCTGSDYCKPRR